jgi:hypothetical protein
VASLSVICSVSLVVLSLWIHVMPAMTYEIVVVTLSQNGFWTAGLKNIENRLCKNTLFHIS